MSNYLLDTSVLSLLAPNRPDASPEFLGWIAKRDTELHISAISVAEVEQGIAKLIRLGGTRTPKSLADWLDRTLTFFADRVLSLDVAVAKVAGQLADQALATGFQPGYADLYIAATAKAHGLTVLTRNLRHFKPLGIDPVDPLTTLPD